MTESGISWRMPTVNAYLDSEKPQIELYISRGTNKEKKQKQWLSGIIGCFWYLLVEWRKWNRHMLRKRKPRQLQISKHWDVAAVKLQAIALGYLSLHTQSPLRLQEALGIKDKIARRTTAVGQLPMAVLNERFWVQLLLCRQKLWRVLNPGMDLDLNISWL